MTEFEIVGLVILVVPIIGFAVFFVGELVHYHRQRGYWRSMCELRRRREEAGL